MKNLFNNKDAMMALNMFVVAGVAGGAAFD